ncbi:HK97 gp10 family phage protein [Sphingomonas nostoxanthinifaciens]|uniref:HK97 gp10 family phage protein n=1 Tax=Sphingomonas nostoxanthinifaciens TaxID=2872652 RepID=UPI001CC2129C|nr:HK97 gp10 family phage protein [Sphingomonas nostoxanthinifaciens]
MATIKGRADVARFFQQLPAELGRKVLLGAARAAANIVAAEARQRSISSEVTDAIKVAARREEGRVVAKVQVKGPGAYIAPWLEYGTDPHFITVDESQRRGMSVGKINRSHAEGSLVINGQFVGNTVHHPGARPNPFLRPALDAKEAEAIAAAQTYINARITREGITGPDEPEDTE